MVQAPAPARLIEGGMPTEATIAQVLVSKYADHLPLYRQAQIYARQGIELDRSTLADWVGHAAWHLRPLHAAPARSSSRSAQNCSPTRPRRRCSILAAAAPRPASYGPMPLTTGHGADPIRRAWPMSTHPTAKPSGPSSISRALRAFLQVDGYAGYRKLADRGDVRLAFCWSMFGVTSTSSPRPVRHRSPAKRSNALLRSTRSRKTSVAAVPRSAGLSGSRKAGR